MQVAVDTNARALGRQKVGNALAALVRGDKWVMTTSGASGERPRACLRDISSRSRSRA